jgi:type II secretory pathway pseudopilin PulG
MRPGRSKPRHGLTLLEVVVSLAILGTAGIAIMGMAHESFDAARRAIRLDREVRAGSAFLDAVTLWTRAELDQRLGERRQGPWWLRIDHATETIYAITLSDSTRRQLLQTIVFRPADRGE